MLCGFVLLFVWVFLVCGVSEVGSIRSEIWNLVRLATTYICLHKECIFEKKLHVQLLTVPSFALEPCVTVTE